MLVNIHNAIRKCMVTKTDLQRYLKDIMDEEPEYASIILCVITAWSDGMQVHPVRNSAKTLEARQD